MHTYAEAKPQHQRQAQVRTADQQSDASKSAVQLMENRPPAGTPAAFQALTNSSPMAVQLRSYQALANQVTLQREAAAPACAACANRTGLPDTLKAGVEALSGMSLDHVRVHYNSAQPAQLNALAYAQGRDIHLAPGQERHLPHETWHVVQQAQGRVKPTLQMKGLTVNDDVELEAEADLMGARAVTSAPGAAIQLAERAGNNGAARMSGGGHIVQRNVGFHAGTLASPFFRAVNAGGAIIRPNWVGHWAGAAAIAGVGAGNSRNHIVAYHHIAESLVNISNTIYTGRAGGVALPAAVATLTALSAALYPNLGAEYAVMVAHRTALVTAINNVANYAAPTALEEQAMAQAATLLEGDLMSAPQNVRAGNTNMNQRVGNNIDATYRLTQLPAFAGMGPGAAFLHGNVMPAPWLAVVGGIAGAQWGQIGAGGPALGVGANFYVMDPLHNQMVESFTAHATAHLGANVTVVRNDDAANPVPGYTLHAPLSSTVDPGGAGYPVILFDPAGVNLPISYA